MEGEYLGNSVSGLRRNEGTGHRLAAAIGHGERRLARRRLLALVVGNAQIDVDQAITGAIALGAHAAPYRQRLADDIHRAELETRFPYPPGWANPVLEQLQDELLLQRTEEHTSELQSLRHLVCRL